MMKKLFFSVTFFVLLLSQIFSAELKTENIPSILKEAQWIWNSNPDGDLTNLYVQFRKSFEIKDVLENTKVYITADQAYRLYVNGKYVASGPARGYQISWPYDEINVSKYLKVGKNLIAIRAYTPNRSSFGYLTQGMAGVLFAADFGNGVKIVSNSSWKSRRQDGCNRDTVPFSLQITGNQEMIDFNIEDSNWMNENYDDSKWSSSSSGRVWNSMPYYTLEARGTPMMDEQTLLGAKLIGTSNGKSEGSQKFIRNVSALLKSENLKHAKVDGDSSSVTFKPSKDGEFQSAVFDFGKFMVGMPILEIEGAKGGEIVDIQFSEWVDEDLQPSIMTFTHSRISLAGRVICKSGALTHEFFHLMGFRYALVRVRNNPDSQLTVTPKVRWAAYPLGGENNFSTSNEYVNKLWQACRHGQRICTLDAYVDTPMREQAMWWGDARVQSWNTFMLENDAKVLRRGIRIMTGQHTPSGLLYGHAPTMAHTCILPDFNLTWILTLWDYYWQTGDVEAYLSHKDTVDMILKYFDSFTNPNTGLINFDERYWLFLDWTKIQKNGQPTLLSMWLLYALQNLEKLADAANMPQEKQEYALRAEKIRTAIMKNCLNSDGIFIDGIFQNGKLNPNTSIHVQVLARLCKLEFNFEKATQDLILPYLNGAQKPDDPSAYWVVYLLDLMIDEGYAEPSYNYIKTNWKEMAEYGSTFENFNPKKLGVTHSHAWSAHPLFLLPKILLGVKQTAPAWKTVSIKPNYLEDEARAIYPTPQGQLKVSYKKHSDGTFKLDIEKPENMQITK